MAVFGSLRMVLYTKELHHFTFEAWQKPDRNYFDLFMDSFLLGAFRDSQSPTSKIIEKTYI